MSWEHFQSNRIIPESHKIISCYAAFNHMRIRRDGDMSPCCFSTKQLRWKKGEVGLKDFWFGDLNDEYRKHFLSESLHAGCGTCAQRIQNKIIPPINEYDWNVGDERLKHAMDSTSWPKIFEFEISNLCNMACPMCMGDLSSKHMLGRDKDVKVYNPNVFDDDENLEELIEQFKEFIPQLDEIRFTGGEPFAHKAFYRIADLITEINPKMNIQVCTNGSVYNKKVQKICDQSNLKLTMSIDTVIPKEYEQIRIGGAYEETFANIQKFKNNAKSVMVNATLMSVNAENISKLFEYGIENNFKVFINTYSRAGRFNSPDWSLNTVNPKILKKSINDLQNINLPKHKKNRRNWRIEIGKTIKLLQNGLLND